MLSVAKPAKFPSLLNESSSTLSEWRSHSLPDERWRHIEADHPELTGSKTDVIEAISTTEIIFEEIIGLSILHASLRQ